MKTLILIDLSSIYWANYHATIDQEVSAAYDQTVARVHKLRNGYDHCAVCLDSPPYFRKEILPTYKAQRDAPPAVAIELLNRVKKRLRDDGLLLWEAKGYEADDIAATALQLSPKDWAVTIASSDKDLCQLVSDTERVSLRLTHRDETWKEEQVVAKFGVHPNQMADFLALTGDKSDNVPGIAGVGPVNAAKLLMTFGSLEEVLTGAPNMKPSKVRDNIIADAEKARLARRLVELRTDAPLKFEEIFEEREVKPLQSDYDGFADGDDPEEEFVPISPPPEETPGPVVEPQSPSHKSESSDGPGDSKQPSPEPSKPNGQKSVEARAEIIPYDRSRELEPHSIGAAFSLAKGLFESRIYAKFPTRESIMAAIIRGRELGIGALTACDVFHCVDMKGRLTLVSHAHFITARCMDDPDCEYFQFVDGDETFAEYETKHRKHPKPTRLRYTLDDAKLAGLCRPPRDGKEPGNWITRPKEMLRKTTAVQLCRIVYPGRALGLYSLEELGYDT